MRTIKLFLTYRLKNIALKYTYNVYTYLQMQMFEFKKSRQDFSDIHEFLFKH